MKPSGTIKASSTVVPTPKDLKVSVCSVLEPCFRALCFFSRSLIVTLLHQKLRPASPYSYCAFNKSLLRLMNCLKKARSFWQLLSTCSCSLNERSIVDVNTVSQQKNRKNISFGCWAHEMRRIRGTWDNRNIVKDPEEENRTSQRTAQMFSLTKFLPPPFPNSCIKPDITKSSCLSFLLEKALQYYEHWSPESHYQSVKHGIRFYTYLIFQNREGKLQL